MRFQQPTGRPPCLVVAVLSGMSLVLSVWMAVAEVLGT